MSRQKAQAIIWDLDNTLYRFTPDFEDHCNQAAAKAAVKLGFHDDYDHCLNVARDSFRTHHFSIYQYLDDGRFQYRDFHHVFHEAIDDTHVKPIKGLRQKLEENDMPQIILTNASRDWATRAVRKANLDHLFRENDILAMEDFNYIPKARGTDGYQKAMSLLHQKTPNIEPGRVLFVDDLERNLKIGHIAGMQTALVHACDETKSAAQTMDHVHDMYDCTTDVVF
jgi:FMN phosphatase YigB (HAD superfamily)